MLMGQVLVRNLEDRVIDRLKAKAELKGHSLEQELRDVLTAAASFTPDEKVALFRKVRTQMPACENFDGRAAIRHVREYEFDECLWSSTRAWRYVGRLV